MNSSKAKFFDLYIVSSVSNFEFPVIDFLFVASLLTLAKCIAKHTFISFTVKSVMIDSL